MTDLAKRHTRCSQGTALRFIEGDIEAVDDDLSLSPVYYTLDQTKGLDIANRIQPLTSRRTTLDCSISMLMLNT